jgi:hypothetical protein
LPIIVADKKKDKKERLTWERKKKIKKEKKEILTCLPVLSSSGTKKIEQILSEA